MQPKIQKAEQSSHTHGPCMGLEIQWESSNFVEKEDNFGRICRNPLKGVEYWRKQTWQIPRLEVVNVEFRYNLDGPLQAIHLIFQVIRNQLDIRRREFETRKRRRHRH